MQRFYLLRLFLLSYAHIHFRSGSLCLYKAREAFCCAHQLQIVLQMFINALNDDRTYFCRLLLSILRDRQFRRMGKAELKIEILSLHRGSIADADQYKLFSNPLLTPMTMLLIVAR